MPASPIGALLCLPLAVLLSAACAGLESTPASVPPGGPAPGSVAQGGTTPPSATPPQKAAQPLDATRGGAGASAPPGRAATPAASAPARTGIAKTAAPASAASRAPASPAPASQAPRKESQAAAPEKPAAAPPLDLASLQQRLRQTNAIGVVTKIALKNQVDDLLEQFRAYYQGRQHTTLAALRQPYDRLLLKVLALLQDGDPSLAGAISASREAIWGVLADPVKFASIRD